MDLLVITRNLLCDSAPTWCGVVGWTRVYENSSFPSLRRGVDAIFPCGELFVDLFVASGEGGVYDLECGDGREGEVLLPN